MMQTILILLLTTSTVFAGNGAGTMSSVPQSGISNGSNIDFGSMNSDIDKIIQKQLGLDKITTKPSSAAAIILYQGETSDSVFIQYGTNKGSRWNIEGFKVDKTSSDLRKSVVDAIIKSKVTKEWSTIGQ